MPAGGRLARAPALGVRLVHLLEDPPDVVLEPPVGVVRLEAAVVADPPDVVADPVSLLVRPIVQLGGGVVGPGEGAAAKAGRPEAEIAAVLLDEDVRRDLLRAEEAVERVVD